MAITTTQVVPGAIPDNFTALDRLLLERTDRAISEGRELERWCRDPNRKIREVLLDLKRPYRVPNKVFGYISDVTIAGVTLPAIGVRQEVEFGRLEGPNREERLKRYVLEKFLPSAHWTYPDGYPGGFTYEQLLYCTIDGQLGRYPDGERETVQDWTLIGTKYRWSLFTVFLHDFVVRFGPITKRFQEAATVVQHPDFIHIVERPAPGDLLEVAIGYPFIDYAPIPNNFGFGPGKFNWAVKLFSFRLRQNGDIRCDMDFVAGARPKKVFAFGKHVPCPLYGTVDALQGATFGLYNAMKFHDWMDLGMMAQHARVHQALMEGSSRIFAESS